MGGRRGEREGTKNKRVDYGWGAEERRCVREKVRTGGKSKEERRPSGGEKVWQRG